MQTVTLEQPTSVLEQQREDHSTPWLRQKTGMVYLLTVLDRLEAKGRLLPLDSGEKKPQPAVHPLAMDYHRCVKAMSLPPINMPRRLMRAKIMFKMIADIANRKK